MDNISLKRELTLEELGILEAEMLKRGKKSEVAWALWTLLHFFGGHRFYTENYGYASAMLISILTPLIGIIILISLGLNEGFQIFMLYFLSIILACSLIWTWIDALFLNKRIEALNNQIELEIINNLKKKFN